MDKRLCVSRWIQILLMLLLVVWLLYTETDLVLSYTPSSHAPVSRECGPGQNRSEFWFYHDGALQCPCLRRTCLPKCCPRGQSFMSQTNLTCALNNLSRSDEVSLLLQGVEFLSLDPLSLNTDEYFVFPGKPVCHEGYQKKITGSNRHLMKNGIVLAKRESDWIYIDIDGFCMDLVDGRVVILTYYDCVRDGMSDKEEAKVDTVLYVIYICLNVISLLLLMATIAVYAALPLLKTIYGKLLICYLTCLVVDYFNHLISISFGPSFATDHSVYVYFERFFSYAIFTWLTTICFDIWSVFSRPLQAPSPHSEGRWFLLYSLFGWGGPALSTAATVMVGVVPLQSDSCITPRFVDDSCIFNQGMTYVMFDALPGYFLMFTNLVLFVSTLVNLCWLHGRQTDTLSDGDSRRHAASDGLCLYMKLSVAMGVQWMLYGLLIEIGRFYLYSVVICTNGLVLFIFLICNDRVLKLILQHIKK